MAGRFFKRNKVEEAPDRVEEFARPEEKKKKKKSAKANGKDTTAGLPDFVAERVTLHRFLIDKINLSILDSMEEDELHDELRPLVWDYVKTNNFPLSKSELDTLIKDIADEMLGLGPIEPLLDDDTISDILVVGAGSVFIERFGKLEPTDIRFKDEDHLLRIVNKIVASVGRRVDESSPLVDARLADGSRVNVAIRPVAVDGPQVSIRKFSKNPYSLKRLVAGDALAPAMAAILSAAVEGKISLIVSGGTGSGKTTMLNALSA